MAITLVSSPCAMLIFELKYSLTDNIIKYQGSCKSLFTMTLLRLHYDCGALPRQDLPDEDQNEIRTQIQYVFQLF